MSFRRYRRSGGTVRCGRCWGEGHNRRGCPKNSEAQKLEYKTGSSARTCSYCNNAGHNKATCQKRKTDRVEYVKENSQYRQTMLNKLVEQGIGVGALLTTTDYDYEEAKHKEYLCMVDSISWSLIDVKRRSRRTILAHKLNFTGDYGPEVTFPFCDGDTDDTDFVVVSGVSEAAVRHEMPISWLDGKDSADKYF